MAVPGGIQIRRGFFSFFFFRCMKIDRTSKWNLQMTAFAHFRRFQANSRLGFGSLFSFFPKGYWRGPRLRKRCGEMESVPVSVLDVRSRAVNAIMILHSVGCVITLFGFITNVVFLMRSASETGPSIGLESFWMRWFTAGHETESHETGSPFLLIPTSLSISWPDVFYLNKNDPVSKNKTKTTQKNLPKFGFDFVTRCVSTDA